MQVVAVGILVSDGRVLLGLRSRAKQWYAGVWDFPGGHVEEGETANEALRRELAEELGVDAIVPDVPVRTFSAHDAGARALQAHVFPVEQWAGAVRNAAPDEHDELRWFSAAQARFLNLAHPEWTQLINAALTPSQPQDTELLREVPPSGQNPSPSS